MAGMAQRRQERLNRKKLVRRRRRRRVTCVMLLFICVVTVGNINSVFGDDGKSGEKFTEIGSGWLAGSLYEGKQGESTNRQDLWNLVLVNPNNRIADDFNVELKTLSNGQAVDERIYPDLQNMMDDARAQGLFPTVCSGYRTQEKQQQLFDNQVNKYIQQGLSRTEAEKESGIWVAVPGTSEHQLGLAVDIVSANNQQLNKEQETTPEQRWLMENSYKYGFILRYPEDKSHITGIGYEPWHYRYVGKEAAQEIYDRKICLEEYLGAQS